MVINEKTNRGFSLIKFEDHYGCPCSIQESSVDTQLWIGVEDVFHNPNNPTERHLNGDNTYGRMLLTKEKVEEILPYLIFFTKVGRLPDENEANGTWKQSKETW